MKSRYEDMRVWNRRKGQTPMLHYFLFAYWLILLIWQNMGGGENRTGADLVIKCGLIIMLFFYYFMHMTGLRRDVLIIVMALLMIYAAAKIPDGLNLSEALYYFFPILFILLIYGAGWKFELHKDQLIQLCNMLICVVAYIAIYAVIFCFDQFANAFSITNAYGNELRSFLFSSHEYGMYLAFAIMAAILCLEFDKEGAKRLKVFYIAAIVLFSVNLILTFSRTSILTMVVMLLCYTFAFAKKHLRAIICWGAVAAALVILIVPALRDFVWTIVMKENTDAGREDLIEAAMVIFRRGDLWTKLVGTNYQYVEAMLKNSHNFSSFHNAYIQQLVCNGYIGVAMLVTLTLLSLRDIYVTVKLKSEWSHLSKFFVGFALSSVVFMMFNTTVLYASSIDSYFLTLFASIVPKCVNQSIREGTFDLPKKENLFDKSLR